MVRNSLMRLSFKFRKDWCFRWGDIQLLVTMYIWYYTPNNSQFWTKNLNFLERLLTNQTQRLCAWEVLECKRFGDISLIGIPVLMSSSHMSLPVAWRMHFMVAEHNRSIPAREILFLKDKGPVEYILVKEDQEIRLRSELTRRPGKDNSLSRF